MHLIHRYLFADIATIRSVFLWRGVMLLLAFDAWLLNASHAGRYGAGAFNVAHFAWMDTFLPMPSAALYSGVCMLTGVLALFGAIRGGGRLVAALVFLLYTYSWAMSMLDSYQHHVLLSWILLCMIFLPEGSLSAFLEKKLPKRREPSAPKTSTSSPSPEKPQEDTTQEASGGGKNKKKAGGKGGKKAKKGKGKAASVEPPIPAPEKVRVEAEEPHAKQASASSTEGLSFWQRWWGQKDEGMLFGMTPADSPAPQRHEGIIKSQAWGFVLMMLIAAVVYLFTALNKSEAGWEASLRALFSKSPAFQGFQGWARGFVSEQIFWTGMTIASIGVQLQIAVGYLLVPFRDVVARKSRIGLVLRLLITFGMLSAVAFHLSVEWLMRLDIGWFSYYMIWLAFVAMAPASWLEWVAGVFVSLRELVLGKLPKINRREILMAWGLVAAFAYFGLPSVDMPGDSSVLWVVLGVSLWVIVAMWGDDKSVLRDALAMGVAVLSLWASMTFSHTRYDLYRWWGGDLYRRAEYTQSLLVYRKAEKYAPKGKSRAKKMRRIEQILRSQGKPVPR
ncbi:MAG: hypothetical protein H6727_11315 [Myxococcales bacterium]|nr:hypothetical protein [Myxococcales bacterium]